MIVVVLVVTIVVSKRRKPIITDALPSSKGNYVQSGTARPTFNGLHTSEYDLYLPSQSLGMSAVRFPFKKHPDDLFEYADDRTDTTFSSRVNARNDVRPDVTRPFRPMDVDDGSLPSGLKRPVGMHNYLKLSAVSRAGITPPRESENYAVSRPRSTVSKASTKNYNVRPPSPSVDDAESLPRSAATRFTNMYVRGAILPRLQMPDVSDYVPPSSPSVPTHGNRTPNGSRRHFGDGRFLRSTINPEHLMRQVPPHASGGGND